MTREELIIRLERMVRTDKITLEEAAAILRRFDAGILTAADLALAASLSAAPIITAELAALAASESVAGRVLLQRVSYSGRRRLTIRLADEFEERGFAAVRSFISGKISPQDLHAALLKEVSDDLLRESVLGAGRDLLPSELARLRPRIESQAAYLQRFMDEVSFRAASGREMSEKAIFQRLRMYKGEGRQSFYELGEAGFGPDYVFDYIAEDDDGTCKPCMDAMTASPYLAGLGIFPTQVCRGRGKCRCVREPRYAPGLARFLRGQ